MKTRIAVLCLAVFLLTDSAMAADFKNNGHRCRPVGTWLIDIIFPDVPTPLAPSLAFQQLLTLHADRTMQETNTTLHPNASPLTAPLGAPPAKGSDGFGTWKRLPRCQVQFVTLKFVYAGDPIMSSLALSQDDPPKGPPPPGVPIGFFKVSGIAKINGDMYSTKLGDVSAELIFGSDPFAEDAVRIPAGASMSTGMRLLITD